MRGHGTHTRATRARRRPRKPPIRSAADYGSLNGEHGSRRRGREHRAPRATWPHAPVLIPSLRFYSRTGASPWTNSVRRTGTADIRQARRGAHNLSRQCSRRRRASSSRSNATRSYRSGRAFGSAASMLAMGRCPGEHRQDQRHHRAPRPVRRVRAALRGARGPRVGRRGLRAIPASAAQRRSGAVTGRHGVAVRGGLPRLGPERRLRRRPRPAPDRRPGRDRVRAVVVRRPGDRGGPGGARVRRPSRGSASPGRQRTCSVGRTRIWLIEAALEVG